MRPGRGDRAGDGPQPYFGASSTADVSAQRRLTVPHHASSARLVRRELAADLDEQACGLSSDLIDDAAAVATELVGNAVRHAAPLPGGVITVDWYRHSDGLEIRVTDGGSAEVPMMRVVTPEAVGGRGLAIVATLATRWGVAPAERGRCVWAWLGEASQVAS
ncbi:MAG TPA: ATP-binding protein [Micromonosporaceae bacterium]|nr:ATP-binding protein [Micromonosporaceae bacterium]